MKKGDENSPEKEGPSPAAEKSTSVGGVRRILFRGLIYSVLFFLLLIHEHLQALKALQQILNYLSARGIHFEDQKIILHP